MEVKKPFGFRPVQLVCAPPMCGFPLKTSEERERERERERDRERERKE